MARDNATLDALRERLVEIDALDRAQNLLAWDQSVYMPDGGAAARGRQIAVLTKIKQERASDPELGRLIDAAEKATARLSADNDDAAHVRKARYDFERANKVPPAFWAEIEAHHAELYSVWAKARPANDFGAVRDGLARNVELSRRFAGYHAPYAHIMDPLIAENDEGMTVQTVDEEFARLRRDLVPLVTAVTAQPAADDSMLKQRFPLKKQWNFGLAVIKRYGYDFERGRQDTTPHPFEVSMGIGDVRITTRFQENDLADGLFSTLHESGHAMYEQGIDVGLDGTPLADGVSAAVHESQSRLWENLVGRSRPFWRYFYPKLQRQFRKQLKDVSFETFYQAINKVARSLIRTDADELTYNLHVIIRFDLERQLLDGSLSVDDLPEVWRARYASDIGIASPDDKDGCLQDVHWYAGFVGGVFQGYTLGNILSAQFFEQALKAHPDLEAQFEAGRFATLRKWLTRNIYRHGSKYSSPDLIQRVTGRGLDSAPYIRYLNGKYRPLYGL
jgi:carboxypeptidase Taq